MNIRIVGEDPFSAMRFNLIGNVLVIPDNEWTLATIQELLQLNQSYGLTTERRDWEFVQFGDW